MLMRIGMPPFWGHESKGEIGVANLYISRGMK